MTRTTASRAAAGLMLLAFSGPLAAQSGETVILPIADLTRPLPGGDPYLLTPRIPGSLIVLGEHSLHERPVDEDADAAPEDRFWLPRRPWFGFQELLETVHAIRNISGELASLANGAAFGVDAAEAEAVRETLTALRNRLPVAITAHVSLTRTVAGRTEVVLERDAVLAGGRTHSLSAVQQQNIVRGMHVELAQASSVGNPWIVPAATGAMVALRAFPGPRNDAAVVECVVRRVLTNGDQALDTGDEGCGPLDRFATSNACFAAVLLTTRGQATSQRWLGADEAWWELRLQLDWRPRPQNKARGVDFCFLSLPELTDGFRSTTVDSREDIALREADRPTDTWASFCDHGCHPCTEDNHLHVSIGEDTPAVQLRAERWFEQFGRAPRVLARVYDAAAGTGFGDDGKPTGDARALAAAELELVAGRWATIQSFDEQSYLYDWSVEVAQASRIPEPHLRRTAQGVWLDLRLDGDTIECRGTFVPRRPMLPRKRSLAVAMETPRVMSGHANGDIVRVADLGTYRLPPVAVFTEHPSPLLLPIVANVALPPAGQRAIVRSRAADALGQDRELIVVIERAQPR